ncbi:hypothetical protein CAI21_11895 [Alkalilimnicola ehrlichii]|uniref:Basal-body rod modification protein FlgD n=1 Tax=Alkalilimnicola ehrlichii TaxID=351052 RepID=A0A3E0WUS0_9GAMM|nr:flagellar hook assembly protein FlgD [Alkalilimnicola ehrlichii]RFA28562.1 hypothetical protein CAI21_11895 [Alkalilimnicola ehrlichii]RFA35725.1 hypothetical protein CAL65_12415 [Alkalilimnicola ehrlichii]
MNLSALGGSGVLGEQRSASHPQNELGQQDFLTLMIAQLQNQDPFNPMDNGEFLSQIAQFTTASGITELQESFKKFQQDLAGDQALRAASLIDREVIVETNKGSLKEEGGMRGFIQLPRSVDNLTLRIYSESGEFVRQISLGAQNGGEVPFTWDGVDSEGRAMPPGRYQVRAETVFMGETIEVATLMGAKVTSVSLSKNGGSPMLSLEGLGELSLADVRQIM